MLVLNGKQIELHRDAIRRNKHGDVIFATNEAVACKEILAPRTHKRAFGFRIEDRAKVSGL